MKFQEIQKSDLEEYSVGIEREPVQGEFAGYDNLLHLLHFQNYVNTIPAMAEMLNVQKAEEDTALFTHLTSEITNRANSDRVKHIEILLSLK